MWLRKRDERERERENSSCCLVPSTMVDGFYELDVWRFEQQFARGIAEQISSCISLER